MKPKHRKMWKAALLESEKKNFSSANELNSFVANHFNSLAYGKSQECDEGLEEAAEVIPEGIEISPEELDDLVSDLGEVLDPVPEVTKLELDEDLMENEKNVGKPGRKKKV